MPRRVTITALIVAVILVGLWATGKLTPLHDAIQQMQHAAQNRLAAAVRAIRAGQPGALAALLLMTFGYGVLHAAGPGHGKMLIGGYAVAKRVRPMPVIAIALAASLAQAGVAILLVYTTLAALDWTREAVLGLSDDVFAPVSYGLVGLVGIWMILRSLRHMGAAPARLMPIQGHGATTSPMQNTVPDLVRPISHTHGTGDGHVHDAHCGHAHGPSLEQIADVTTWRQAGLLIAGVAMRPCSGALFLLILTWRLGIGSAGIAGVVAMGLGTALVTVGVAMLAIWAREGLLSGLNADRFAVAVPILELVIGTMIVVVCAGQLIPML
jgi:nickel/cobalt transporter (NicO) family protein